MAVAPAKCRRRLDQPPAARERFQATAHFVGHFLIDEHGHQRLVSKIRPQK
jgi:hypothetical protein